jgi:hypothetical protein
MILSYQSLFTHSNNRNLPFVLVRCSVLVAYSTNIFPHLFGPAVACSLVALFVVVIYRTTIQAVLCTHDVSLIIAFQPSSVLVKHLNLPLLVAL